MRALLVTVLLGLSCLRSFADDPKPREVHTDVMIDDLMAYAALAEEFQPTRGKGLLFVTCGGDTMEKARALHTITFLFGIPEAQVVPGLSGPEIPDVPYVRDYKHQDGQEDFIRPLASHRGPRAFKAFSLESTTSRFRQAHDKVSVLFLASPYTFMHSNPQTSAEHFSEFILGGFVKYQAGQPHSTAFNMHDSRLSSQQLIYFAAAQGIPTLSIPSTLVQTDAQLANAIKEPQGALLRNPAHEGIMPLVLAGMKRYRDHIADVLSRTYGFKAPFVTLWDPERESWVQDLVVTLVAQDRSLITQSEKVAYLIGETLDDSGLGFPITAVSEEKAVTQEVRGIDRTRLSQKAPQVFARTVLTPDFSPEATINSHDHTPIALITKTAIDDMGALRMLLGLGHRLKLVISESTNTVMLTTLLDKVLKGFGRNDITLATGIGDSDSAMEGISSLGVIERHLTSTGLLAKDVLDESEIERLKAAKVENQSATSTLIAFLEKNPKVDLVVTTSFRTLSEALTRRPDLAGRIRTAHLMGGVRSPTLASDGSGGWTDGQATRNTEIDPTAAGHALEILQKHGVRTFYYSSHLSGGMLTPSTFEKSLPVWKRLQAQYPVERVIEQMRLNWNDGLIAQNKKVDRETNFGPPLSWLMAAMVALGDDNTKYFSATPGKITSRGTLIDFTHDPSSSLQVLDLQSTYVYLDQLVAYLSEKAHARRRGPSGLLQWMTDCQRQLLQRWKRE